MKFRHLKREASLFREYLQEQYITSVYIDISNSHPSDSSEAYEYRADLTWEHFMCYIQFKL